MPLLSLIRFLNIGREATANVRFTKIKRTANSFEKRICGAPAKESMRQDLNLRPLRPERSALPS